MMPLTCDHAAIQRVAECDVAGLLRAKCCVAGNRVQGSVVAVNGTLPPTTLQQVCTPMDQLSGYAHRPFSFVLRYLRRRPGSHLVILLCVVAAVACSVSTQYGVKFLVDS